MSETGTGIPARFVSSIWRNDLFSQKWFRKSMLYTLAITVVIGLIILCVSLSRGSKESAALNLKSLVNHTQESETVNHHIPEEAEREIPPCADVMTWTARAPQIGTGVQIVLERLSPTSNYLYSTNLSITISMLSNVEICSDLGLKPPHRTAEEFFHDLEVISKKHNMTIAHPNSTEEKHGCAERSCDENGGACVMHFKPCDRNDSVSYLDLQVIPSCKYSDLSDCDYRTEEEREEILIRLGNVSRINQAYFGGEMRVNWTRAWETCEKWNLTLLGWPLKKSLNDHPDFVLQAYLESMVMETDDQIENVWVGAHLIKETGDLYFEGFNETWPQRHPISGAQLWRWAEEPEKLHGKCVAIREYIHATRVFVFQAQPCSTKNYFICQAHKDRRSVSAING